VLNSTEAAASALGTAAGYLQLGSPLQVDLLTRKAESAVERELAFARRSPKAEERNGDKEQRKNGCA